MEYKHSVYEVCEEDGLKHFVYLLDETLELDHISFISTNITELIVKSVTGMSYRESAAKVTEMEAEPIL